MSDEIYKKQVGGNHYKSMTIQPSEFINKNNIVSNCFMLKFVFY